jgi:hypothetical protein
MSHKFVSLAVCVFVTVCVAEVRAAGAKLSYNKDVRPILADTCFKCHGPDSAARKGDLRIDKRDDAMAVIKPGKPEDSEFFKRLLSKDPEEVMPPPATKKVLKPEQIEILKRWITEGAEYEPHWSFITPTKPQLPTIKNAAWVKNPIDAFVLAKLEAAGLQPAPQADRRTLARRASLDITGLPPKPELVEEFVNDTASNAFEKYIDKLLATQQWGEHRGRHWLDVARYADTHGIHFDNYREMWAYRDWVINAFNKNQPFDQFTIEQLAGDLLPEPTVEQRVATGFNRCNITTSEGGTIPEEYYVLYTRDRTETASQVWLGLTAGCAVCHTHKFDPLSQREFYEMAAFFNNTTQNAMDGNAKDPPPILAVPLVEDRPRMDALLKEIPAAKQAVENRRKTARPMFDEWLASAKPDALGPGAPTEGQALFAPFAEGQGEQINVTIGSEQKPIKLTKTAKWQDGVNAGSKALQIQGAAADLGNVGEFKKSQAYSMSAWVKLAANDSQGAICARMDEQANNYRGWDFWVQGRRVGTHLIHSWPDDALKVVAEAQVKGNEWTHVVVTYDGSGTAAGVKVYYNGAPQKTLVENDKLKTDSAPTVPLKIGSRHKSEPLSAAGLSELRLYNRALAHAEIEALAKSSRYSTILAKAADQRTDAEKNDLFGWWLGTNDKPFQELTAKVSTLEGEQAAIKARGTITHVSQEKNEEAMAFILFRGEYDQRRDPVKPGTPAILPPMPKDAPKNRLGLAKWLLQPEHPLTARVTVNRFWQEVFGNGIVRSAGDFGIAGELPTHPELLDWLAIDFRENSWDVKRFFKQVLMSATYQQSAAAPAEKLERDPSNRLLARGPRFRMDAEMVRDSALSVSGLLVPKIGGPSVKPYQPAGVWEAVAMIGSNTRDYRRDTGDSLYRRSMYTFWKRSAPPAMLEVFNAPNRETCTVRRERTNTPLQALATLNDEQYIEAARQLATLVVKQGGNTFDSRINFLSHRVLSRPFQPNELAIVRDSFAALEAFYKSHEADAKQLIAVGESKPDTSLSPAELAAWTMLSNELLNLDEVLNK